MSYQTTYELLEEARSRVDSLRVGTVPGTGAPREFSLAITAIEDAQMRTTRGLAIEQGKFAPADLEAS